MGNQRYGVMLDAGSSGTRVHIYSWLKASVARNTATAADLERLPILKTKNKKWTMKVHPGVSTFRDHIDQVGPAHLKDLLDFALEVIPSDEVEETPIFVYATAGMRLLDDESRDSLLKEICRYTREHTQFSLPDCDSYVQVISGETEGLYGWVAANYLVGGFDRPDDHAHGKGHHTYGFLDMGGASAQIAFAPNSTEVQKHAEDLKLLRLRNINGQQEEYRVFVTTFLGYGADEARRRFIDELAKSPEPGHSGALADPCLPTGLEVTKDGEIIAPGSPEEQGSATYLRGTGKFSDCLELTYPLLDKDAACPDQPCLFNGVHVPAIDFDVNHFIGVSNFWHGTHDVFNMGHDDAAYDFNTYQKRVTEFCSKDWAAIRADIEDKKMDEKVDEEKAAETCFRASWLINILHEGIGIPRVAIEGATDAAGNNGTEEVIESAKQEGFLQPFQAVNKIDDTEVSWTLGKMVLFASSQVTPINDAALPIGFGDNVAGVPENFEHAGGQTDLPLAKGDDLGDPFYRYYDTPDVDDPNYYKVDQKDDGYYEDYDDSDSNSRLNLHHLFRSDNLRRMPGFILFFVILGVVGILLCGRERRANLGRRLCGLFKRGGRSRAGSIQLGRKTNASRLLPFGLGGRRDKYDRLMEQGDIPNPLDFELNNISSDDDKASQSSKASSSSSGRRKHGVATPRRTNTSSPRPSDAFAEASQSFGNGLGAALEKNGGLPPRKGNMD